MSDNRIGELKIRWFVASTAILLVFTVSIFKPLSRNMRTVDEANNSQKRIEELEKRVREIDELKGRLGAIENRSNAAQTQQQKQSTSNPSPTGQ